MKYNMMIMIINFGRKGRKEKKTSQSSTTTKNQGINGFDFFYCHHGVEQTCLPQRSEEFKSIERTYPVILVIFLNIVESLIIWTMF